MEWAMNEPVSYTHLRFFLLALLMQVLTVEIVAKRLRSKMGQHVVPFQRFGPQPGTKAARIGPDIPHGMCIGGCMTMV